MYFKACLKGTCERAASTMFFCVHFGRKWGKRDKKNIEEKNIDEKDIKEKNIEEKDIKGPLLTFPLFDSHISPQKVLTRNLIQPQIRFELK